MIDTLVVKRDGNVILERYQGQNLDEYDYLAEYNHADLLKYKGSEQEFVLKNISIQDIMIYLANFGL